MQTVTIAHAFTAFSYSVAVVNFLLLRVTVIEFADQFDIYRNDSATIASLSHSPQWHPTSFWVLCTSLCMTWLLSGKVVPADAQDYRSTVVDATEVKSSSQTARADEPTHIYKKTRHDICTVLTIIFYLWRCIVWWAKSMYKHMYACQYNIIVSWKLIFVVPHKNFMAHTKSFLLCNWELHNWYYGAFLNFSLSTTA